MQDHKGYIDLFPAIPAEWRKNAAFSNFNSRGRIRVSAAVKDGNISVEFGLKVPMQISIKNRFASSKIKITTNDGEEIIDIDGIDVITLTLPSGNVRINEINI